MTTPLIVVDVQRGFLNEFTHHIPDRVVRLIRRNDHSPILFTIFLNTPDSPYRRLLDWHECAGPPDTDLPGELASFAQPDRVFMKRGFTGLPRELAEFLRANDTRRAEVVGIDTDMCVLKTALDLFDRGIEPTVLTDCCASTAGLQSHLAGLAILSRNIGPHQLRDAGLSDGGIAAPKVRATKLTTVNHAGAANSA